MLLIDALILSITQGIAYFLPSSDWTEASENNILPVLMNNPSMPAICIFLFPLGVKLIVFPPLRDGVSEGQFYQVLLFELDAIRKVFSFLLYLSLPLYYHSEFLSIFWTMRMGRKQACLFTC